MNDYCLEVLVVILLVTMSYSLKLKNTECEQKISEPCKCFYPNGEAIDLSPIGEKKFVSYVNESVIYFYQPCQNMPLYKSNSSLWLYKIIKNITTDPLEVYERLKNGSLTFTVLGTVEEAKFESTNIPFKPQIVYKKGQVEVSLECKPQLDEDSLTVLNGTSVEHNLSLVSPHACVGASDSRHLSAGSVLLVLFFTFGLIYLIGGALILKFLRGAQGLEMIPNYEFWAELPYLVRDGIIFALSCGQTRPNSYERI